MEITSNRFLVVLLGTLSFLFVGYWYIGSSVGTFYRPNATEGNWGLKYSWVFILLIVTNLVVTIYLNRKRASGNKIALTGLSILIVLFALMNISTMFEREHSVTYFIGSQGYEIPWEYNPINGSGAVGGRYFVIHVSYPDFVARYTNSDFYGNGGLTLSKEEGDSKAVSGDTFGESCTDEKTICEMLGSASNSQFIQDGFIYSIHYQGREVIKFENKQEFDDFKSKIVQLFSSFQK
jgi:hypothetical protein